MRVHLLVLNYRGRRLMEECLPSIVEAAACSQHKCDVQVIDNDSGDDSVAWLEDRWPQVGVIRSPNRGLSSFNEIVPALPGPVAILLNNDVKLDRQSIDPLVGPLSEPACFLSAPRCYQFDGETYEGFKTAVAWRWGLVQATALFPGHEPGVDVPGLTASSGAVMAVDRRKFGELGGFDPVFLPGRLEDLDFAFRGYLAGYEARYVPESLAWHLGMATFRAVFGADGCDELALRNTLVFQWKNLRHPRHWAMQLAGLSARLAADLVRARQLPPPRRWATLRAMSAALGRLRQLEPAYARPRASWRREREFFVRFHPSRMAAGALPASETVMLEGSSATNQLTVVGDVRSYTVGAGGGLSVGARDSLSAAADSRQGGQAAHATQRPSATTVGLLEEGRPSVGLAAGSGDPRRTVGERDRRRTEECTASSGHTANRENERCLADDWSRHPISRWYLAPAVAGLVEKLTPTGVRPVHVTALGLMLGLTAAAALVLAPSLAPAAGLLVLAAWLCDRVDGKLARRQGTASAWGAWLDANIDELLDVAWHVAAAYALASSADAHWPWLLLAAFLAGKYLFFHGRGTEKQGTVAFFVANGSDLPNSVCDEKGDCPSRAALRFDWLRPLWHAAGNADVRVHLLVAALLTGTLGCELAIVAVYYQLRWLGRCVQAARQTGALA